MSLIREHRFFFDDDRSFQMASSYHRDIFQYMKLRINQILNYDQTEKKLEIMIKIHHSTTIIQDSRPRLSFRPCRDNFEKDMLSDGHCYLMSCVDSRHSAAGQQDRDVRRNLRSSSVDFLWTFTGFHWYIL